MTAIALTGVGMVPGLSDYQFEMDGYRWGLDCPIFVQEGGFSPGNNGFLTQDQNSSITGAKRMGRDVREAQTWSWQLGTAPEIESPEDALAELALMGSIFLGGVDGFRTARDVKMLRYAIGGRTRVIFGRPGNFDYEPNNAFLGGYLPPAATFRKADALHYDDDEQFVDLRLGMAESGGFAWPATWPLTFNRSTEYVPPWGVVVGGDAPTAPVIEFTGPVLNPAVVVGGMKVAMTGLLPEGAKITFDARPWATTVIRSGVASPNLRLSADSRLSRMRLTPGSYDAIFTGVDGTGTANCRILWRNGWHTL
jgi:hypothetical protein